MTLIQSVTPRVNERELENKVKDMYRNVALRPEGRYHFEMGRGLAERLGYLPEKLDRVPEESISSFAGVGYFFDLADLQKGERVLDLGSGSGMDVFYAALQVGEAGHVVGLDMTKEQLEKSRRINETFDLANVTFESGYIEEVPMSDHSVDVVISNGVINLSSDKEKVFREAARILRPGGRLVLADIVSSEALPESITCNADLWASCIGGAMQEDQYLNLIRKAGLQITEVKDNPYRFLSGSAKGATEDYGIKSISLVAVK